jgi:hypothetical protein
MVHAVGGTTGTFTEFAEAARTMQYKYYIDFLLLKINWVHHFKMKAGAMIMIYSYNRWN